MADGRADCRMRREAGATRVRERLTARAAADATADLRRQTFPSTRFTSKRFSKACSNLLFINGSATEVS